MSASAKSNHVREDHGHLDENEDRDQARFDAASSNLAQYAVTYGIMIMPEYSSYQLHKLT
jgi:hypothetical protein